MTDQTNQQTDPMSFDHRESSGSSTEIAYSVEARLMTNAPDEVCGHLLDQRWKRIRFDETPAGRGIPACHRYSMAGHHGLAHYAAAQALRWWFHAQAEIELKGMCLETRLVKHSITTKYTVTPVAAQARVHGDDRSNMMADWAGKPTTQPETQSP